MNEMRIAKVEAGEYSTIVITDDFGQRWVYRQNENNGELNLGQVLRYPFKGDSESPARYVALFVPVGPNPMAGIQILAIIE